MSIRQLCRETARRPSKALFYFPEENKTGIAPTRLIVGKDAGFNEGKFVSVNWEGKKVRAQILALNDDEEVLNLKDIEWVRKNLQYTTEELPEAEESSEPPRKRVARNKVTTKKDNKKGNGAKQKKKNNRKGCRIILSVSPPKEISTDVFNRPSQPDEPSRLTLENEIILPTLPLQQGALQSRHSSPLSHSSLSDLSFSDLTMETDSLRNISCRTPRDEISCRTTEDDINPPSPPSSLQARHSSPLPRSFLSDISLLDLSVETDTVRNKLDKILVNQEVIYYKLSKILRLVQNGRQFRRVRGNDVYMGGVVGRDMAQGTRIL